MRDGILNSVVHFIDVGQGNMVLLEATDGNYYIVDCNVTNDGEESILNYLGTIIGWGTKVAAFICTHRDARPYARHR